MPRPALGPTSRWYSACRFTGIFQPGSPNPIHHRSIARANWHELALTFLTKAAQGEMVVDRLIDVIAVADEMIGFHLQQAAEKLLKAVLAEHGIDIRKLGEHLYPGRQSGSSEKMGTAAWKPAYFPDAGLPGPPQNANHTVHDYQEAEVTQELERAGRAAVVSAFAPLALKGGNITVR